MTKPIAKHKRLEFNTVEIIDIISDSEIYVVVNVNDKETFKLKVGFLGDDAFFDLLSERYYISDFVTLDNEPLNLLTVDDMHNYIKNKELNNMKNYIQSKLKEENEELVIGCYDKIIDTFSKRSVNRIIENAIDLEHTDIAVTNKGTRYIVEISTVDNEKDFKVKTPNEYKNLYGREI